jgi:inorganic pyrophosphatase
MSHLLYRAHPWHGISLDSAVPAMVPCYLEMVPTDTVKYELDKESGLMKLDRPQLYSNTCPAPYGFVPRTYCGKRVGSYAASKAGRPELTGDGDPLDICIISERPILRADLLVMARPIGGLRAIDHNQADDKIIAVLAKDPIYDSLESIEECPSNLIDRLHHYFLTYKDLPGEKEPFMEIDAIYGRDEAQEVVRLACADYKEMFGR